MKASAGTLLLLLVGAIAPSLAVADDAGTAATPLPVDQAFALSSKVLDGAVAFTWRMPKGYYLYRDRFSLRATNAADALGELQWPAGTRHLDAQFGQVTVFYDQVRLRVPLKGAAQLPDKLQLAVTYQGCLENSVCYPPTTRTMTLDLPPATRQLAQGSDAGRGTGHAAWTWLAVLAAAFAGGVVLNLMPCVLPVLSLKVLSVLHASDDAIGARRRAMAYTAGVMLSFATLGAIALALRASGVQAGWGFQMQQPWIIAALALVMLTVGLGLSGVVHLGAGLAGLGGSGQLDRGLRGDFLTGVLACVVASPCTAPFMGAALAYAFTSASPLAAMPVFLSLGLGLASPFLVMAFVPATARWLPRPGAWMETLKQFLAFPMYATVIWLLWVLGKQRGVDAMAVGLMAAVILALGLWWYERKRFGGALHRVAAVLLIAVSLLPVLALATSPSQPVASQALPAGAEKFTPQRLAQLRERGTPVFVNVTADWCLTCKANHAAVLGRDHFRQLLAKTGTVYLVADYTQPDMAIASLLKSHRAVGLPLYLYFDSEGGTTTLPSVLTSATVERVLDVAHG